MEGHPERDERHLRRLADPEPDDEQRDRPAQGTVRNICTVASTRSSPSRESPEASASAVPTTPPSSSPTTTRWSETPIAAGNVPSATRSAPARAMVPGEASTSGCSTPAALNTCHNTTNSNGPTARRTHRGAARSHDRRTDAGTTASSSGGVRVGAEAFSGARGAAGGGGAWLTVMGAPRKAARMRGGRGIAGMARRPRTACVMTDRRRASRRKAGRGGALSGQRPARRRTRLQQDERRNTADTGAAVRPEAVRESPEAGSPKERQQPRQHAAEATRSRSM